MVGRVDGDGGTRHGHNEKILGRRDVRKRRRPAGKRYKMLLDPLLFDVSEQRQTVYECLFVVWSVLGIFV